MWSCLSILNVQKCRPIIRWLACTSILSLFSSRLYSDQFIFALRSLSYVHSHLPGYVLLSGFAFFLDFFTAFLSFMSIFSCSVPYCPLASGCFWTFLLFFSALCPFSPARFRISLWLPENFGLFSCFSRLYVHFHLLGSVFLSGFRMNLDFSLVFLSFISIWKSIEESGILDHRLFVPKTAFPTAIIRIGKM